ncbi:MAG: hypothetical protein PHQ23_13765 [Candidatus Wallbacteria bacterium]|nr:hypothetical protein [Candidatus Wallbacteria bacterium]
MPTKRWSAEEEAFLQEQYEDLSNKDLADKFNVSEIAIQRKLARLDCHRQKQKKWSKEDEVFMKKNYMKYSDRELARRFTVSEVAIKRKLHRLKLSRAKKRKEKTEPVKNRPVIMMKKKPDIKPAKNNIEVYSIIKTVYELNQKIFHQIWKDEGIVKDLFHTKQGNNAMIVNFKRLGERVLVFGVSE